MADNNHAKQLLVEGVDDQQVVYHLSNYANIPRNAFATLPQNGYESLIENLEVYLLGSELRQLGIIVDADTDLAAKWASVKGKLESFGYSNLPAIPQTDGTIIPLSNQITIGIWVMPNNLLTGMVEDFIAYLIPKNDQLWDYARQCVDGIAPENRAFKPTYKIKASIHTWLAWQEEPGTPLGHAITRRYLDASTEEAQLFINWLKRLFQL